MISRVVGDSQAVIDDGEANELKGTMVVPLNTINLAKIKNLLERMGKPKNDNAMEANDQAHLEHVDRVQGDKKVEQAPNHTSP